jgi:calcineurin-like phosphoesterase family protein
MKFFFTADTHFNHDNIIEYCNRPFKNAEEMNDTLIINWNSVVGEHDTVYH